MHDEAITLAKNLIAIPSASGHESQILQFLDAWYRNNGFTDIRTTDMFSAARLDKARSNKALILCGHIDTVVAGVAADWTHGPYTPAITGDKLYGLGSTDMKAGLAAQMAAAKSCVAGGPAPDTDVWVAAVANEETDGSGAAAFVEWFTSTQTYAHVSCLIAEPTDLERIEIGHRGNRFITLEFSGSSGHASQQASYDASALSSAQSFLAALPSIVRHIQSQYADPLLGKPTFVPTSLQSGDRLSPNKTSSQASLVADLRTTPALDAVFDTWIAELAATYGFDWHYLMPFVGSSLCDETAPLVAAVRQATGISQSSASVGATDQAFFQSAGIDTVVFGPGEFALAHTADEHVSLSKLRRACDIYQEIMQLM